MTASVHSAWLPPEAFRAVGSRRVRVRGEGRLVDTVRDEVARACARFGGTVEQQPDGDADLILLLAGGERAGEWAGGQGGEHGGEWAGGQGRERGGEWAAGQGGEHAGEWAGGQGRERGGEWAGGQGREHGGEWGDEGFELTRRGDATVVLAGRPAGLLYGLFEVVRQGERAFGPGLRAGEHRPAMRHRMLDHWDNVDVHPVMGQVERGYAGGSLFWRDGRARGDLDRVRDYGRLLAASGINAISVNNVNVHRAETHLLTDRIGEVAAIAGALRPYGVRVHLAVNFAAPIVLGALPTADPLDEAVRAWWAGATRQVYRAIPDFGGYLVKADSEGQPGPFGYGRSHADGANMLADALAPYGGLVRWRAFVYNHRQDWRDRSTDRARAAYDHFVPLAGQFRPNAVLQVKHGPIDFQAREPVSPVLAAMPGTRLAVELQATQEYTGQQRHLCYLGPMWSEVLRFEPRGAAGPTVADVVAGSGGRLTVPESAAGDGGRTVPGPAAGDGDSPTVPGPAAGSDSLTVPGPAAGDGGLAVAGFRADGGGLVAVSNAGDDPYWTGHPLAQANLYAAGRLAWAPAADPLAVLDEWIDLTFGPAAERLRSTLHALMDGSWATYEQYTAPLGVGFMVRPGHHYGPDVDGYEYTPWGTYHFADRDGVGVDRTRATGTGFTGQYRPPWSEVYESLQRCPDELLLFFHHVPYGHVLHSGSTVIQHIYDSHFAGAERVAEMRERWRQAAGLVDPELHARVAARLDEQVRSALEWRDQINSYFFRKSGVPDAKGRRIF